MEKTIAKRYYWIISSLVTFYYGSRKLNKYVVQKQSNNPRIIDDLYLHYRYSQVALSIVINTS